MTKNNSSISSTYRYPSYNLETCISKIIEVYKKEALAPISKETVAHDLGVSGKSGSFGTVFAAMKYYGLLEEQGDKTYKINEMIVGKTTAENFNAKEILKLMNNPPVYSKILPHYNAENNLNNLPSSVEVGNMLIKNYKYNETQAKSFRLVFDKNLEFYQKAKEGGISSSGEEDGPSVHAVSEPEDNKGLEQKENTELRKIDQNWDLKEGKVSINISFPKNIDEEDKKKISNLLTFIREQEFDDKKKV